MLVAHFQLQERGSYHALCSHLFYGSYCDHKEERQTAGNWGSWGVYHQLERQIQRRGWRDFNKLEVQQKKMTPETQ